MAVLGFALEDGAHSELGDRIGRCAASCRVLAAALASDRPELDAGDAALAADAVARELDACLELLDSAEAVARPDCSIARDI